MIAGQNKGLRVLVVSGHPERVQVLLHSSLLKFQPVDLVQTPDEAFSFLLKFSYDLIIAEYHLISDHIEQLEDQAKTNIILLVPGQEAANFRVSFKKSDSAILVQDDLNSTTLDRTILDFKISAAGQKTKDIAGEEITRKIMDGALDAIICIDQSGKIVTWNPQAEKLFGWKKEAIIGLSLTETIIPLQYREAHDKGMRHYLATGVGKIMNRLIEITAINHSGNEFPIELTVIPLSEGGKTYFCAFLRDISERKDAERIIRESEAKYRDFFENSMDGIFLTIPDGKILDANPAACRIFGMSRDEICAIGRDGLLAEDPQKVARFLEERKKTGKAKGVLNFKRKDGTVFPAELSSSVFKDASGGERTTIIIRDITERKSSEEALIKSELHLRQILSSTADNFYVIDKECRVVLINESARKNLQTAWGAPVEIGTCILDIMPKEEDEPIRKSLQKVFAGEKVEYELRLSIPKLPEWMLVSYMPVIDANDEVIGAYIMSKDISERKRIEAGLKISIERFETIAATAHDAIWEWNLVTGEIWGNTIHQQLYGLGPGDPAPDEKMWKKHIHPEDRDFVTNDLNAALASDRHSWIAEYRFLTTAGYRNIYDRSYIVRDDNGKPIRIMGSMMDITDRKKNEEEARRSGERFELISRTTNDAVWEWDLITGEMFANETHQHMYGLELNDPVPVWQTWIERMHPEDRDRLIKMQEQALASTSNAFISEYRFNVAGKGYRALYDRCYIARNEEGKPIKMMGSMIDVTERKLIEESLRESEERYRSLVEHAPEALVVFDATTGKFVSVSKSAEKLFKMSREELLQVGPLELSPEFQPDGSSSAELAAQKLGAAIAGEEPYFEWTHIDKEGNTIPCEIWLVRMPSENKVLIRGSVVDISVRKKAEKALRDSEEKYRNLIEQASDPIIIYSMEGWVLSCNNAFLTATGYSAEDVPGLHLSDLLFKDELKRNPLNFELVKKGIAVHDERRARRKDGSVLPVELNSKMMPDGNVMVIARDITERKKAEELLLKEKNFSDSVINNLPGIFAMLNEEGTIVRWNQNFESVTGYHADEIIKMSPLDFVSEDDRSLVAEKMKEGFEKGETTSEIWIYTKKKQRIPYQFNGWRAFIENKPSLIGVGYDLTERKKAEELLRASEEKYRTLVEQAVDAIALYDANGKILDVNTGSVQLLGYSKEELIGMSLSDILTPEEVKVKPVRYDVLSRGESTVKQRKMRKKDGSIVETEVRSQQLPDGRFLSVIRDLTERIIAQEQIKREKDLSDSIINSLPGLFYLIDKNGKYIRWNKLKEEITGYTHEEMAHMNSLDFFEGEERELIKQKIREGFDTGTTEVEAHIVTRNGEKILYYFTGIAIDYEGQRCLMGTGIDISHRKQAEMELESSYKAIRQLTEHLHNIREEERTHIAREIHDELGQKLTVLKMDISWINKKLSIKDDLVKTRMKELLSMLDETVRSVRKISSELRPSLLDDLGLTAAMEWHLNEFEKRVDIKTNFKFCDEFWLPEAMKTGLFRIFQESLTNVARHSKAKRVSVSLERESESVVLSVMDDGIGFDKQNAVSKKTLGILGMKERTSMIGGTYEIISKPGKGTKVVVTVPLSNKN